MDDSLYGRDPSNPAMEAVIGSKRPARYPEQRIVSSSEDPKYGYIRNREYSGSIANVTRKLQLGCRVTIIRQCGHFVPTRLTLLRIRLESVISREAGHKIQQEINKKQKALKSWRDCTPPDRLLTMLIERCWKNQTPPNPQPQAAESCRLRQLAVAPCLDHSVEDPNDDN